MHQTRIRVSFSAMSVSSPKRLKDYVPVVSEANDDIGASDASNASQSETIVPSNGFETEPIAASKHIAVSKVSKAPKTSRTAKTSKTSAVPSLEPRVMVKNDTDGQESRISLKRKLEAAQSNMVRYRKRSRFR